MNVNPKENKTLQEAPCKIPNNLLKILAHYAIAYNNHSTIDRQILQYLLIGNASYNNRPTLNNIQKHSCTLLESHDLCSYTFIIH